MSFSLVPWMNDSDCISFLQWALPRMRMRWAGFRKVRKQVCKRIARRLRVLGLPGSDAYRVYLSANPDEWIALDRCCRITLSRFYRDHRVFDFLGETVLPVLATQALQRGDTCLQLWSAGCAGGEEPYSLALLWQRRVSPLCPGVGLQILATDSDPRSLERAAVGCYSPASLKDLPAEWRETAFRRRNREYCLLPGYRSGVVFGCQDLRSGMPAGRFDLILCRNLVFTYYSIGLQQQLLAELQLRLCAGGALVIGAHEALPGTTAGLTHWSGAQAIFRWGGAELAR